MVVGGCKEVTLTCSKSAMMIVHSAVFLPLEGGCEQVTYSLVCCQSNIVVIIPEGAQGGFKIQITNPKLCSTDKEKRREQK